uniref:Uncharacterized protein n=1 Tax=Panagrolaimus davidi TaxID=227884 RepID=A0A914P0L9_9BILA
MAKRSAEAEIADGIPDEPKEKSAKLEANLNVKSDEETPLLDADVEAIKNAAEIEAEEGKEKNDKAEGEHEEDIINENGGVEPIIDEPDDEEGHNNVGHHEGGEEEEEIVQSGEHENEHEEAETEEGETKETSFETATNDLPDISATNDNVEFKVPHLPSKSHVPIVGDTSAAATSDATEENGST